MGIGSSLPAMALRVSVPDQEGAVLRPVLAILIAAQQGHGRQASANAHRSGRGVVSRDSLQPGRGDRPGTTYDLRKTTYTIGGHGHALFALLVAIGAGVLARVAGAHAAVATAPAAAAFATTLTLIPVIGSIADAVLAA